jgi:site-specific DNA-methyltransferase (adenine-specific)
MIRTYSNNGDVVLDNCIGSGTTAIAALNTCRNFIGMELDEKYYEIAVNRVENHRKTLENTKILQNTT